MPASPPARAQGVASVTTYRPRRALREEVFGFDARQVRFDVDRYLWLRRTVLPVLAALAMIPLALALTVLLAWVTVAALTTTPSSWGASARPLYDTRTTEPVLGRVVVTGNFDCGSGNPQCHDANLTVKFTGVEKVIATRSGADEARFDVIPRQPKGQWMGVLTVTDRTSPHVEITVSCTSGDTLTWESTFTVGDRSHPSSGAIPCP